MRVVGEGDAPPGVPAGALAPPHPKVLAFIRELVARIECGEVRSIAIAAVDHNGEPLEGWAKGSLETREAGALMGAIGYLAQKYAADGNQNDAVVWRVPDGPRIIR
jgi:hypothetical protein